MASTLLGNTLATEIFQASEKQRDGPDQALSESIATFGLVVSILACIRVRPDAVPMIVCLSITGAHWFAAPIGFANPAVTLARPRRDTLSALLSRPCRSSS